MMDRSALLFALPLVALLAESRAACAQSETPVIASTAPLRVSAQRDTVLTLADLARLPRYRQRTGAPHHGAAPAPSPEYEGVAMRDVLALVGAPIGAAFRGRATASYVLVEAADGYRVIFSLDEIAPETEAAPIILADRKDGAALSAEEAPLRVIAPGARHSRWIRQVVRISVREAAP